MNRRAMILGGASSLAAASVLLTASAALAEMAVTGGPGPSSPDPGPSPASTGTATGGGQVVSPADGGDAGDNAGDKGKPRTSFVCPHCGLIISPVPGDPGVCTAHSCSG